jgi:hypothetical protein
MNMQNALGTSVHKHSPCAKVHVNAFATIVVYVIQRVFVEYESPRYTSRDSANYKFGIPMQPSSTIITRRHKLRRLSSLLSLRS